MLQLGRSYQRRSPQYEQRYERDMNTPAHLIIGAAAFSRRDAWALNLAAIAGALLPDASLYFMVFWNGVVLGVDENVIFNELYFNDFWQSVFAIDNSLPLWGLGLAVVLLARSKIGIAFFGAGLFHILLDFPLHHDDGRAHFWPFSDWIFESPVSYWDPHAHGHIMSAIERLLIGLVFLAELGPFLLFRLWLSGSGG